MRLWTGIRLVVEQKIEVGDAMGFPTVSHLHGCIDNEATDIVSRVMAFGCVAGDVVKPLADESLS